MYTTKTTTDSRIVITNEYTVSSHLASAIINGEYDVFDYYNEEHLIPKFEEWLEGINQDFEEMAEAENAELDGNGLIYDIEDGDSFFDRCDFYNLMADCVTLKAIAFCNPK